MDSEYKIKCRFLFILTSMGIFDDPILNSVILFKFEVSSDELSNRTHEKLRARYKIYLWQQIFTSQHIII